MSIASVQLGHRTLRDERRQLPAGAGVRAHVVGQPAHFGVLRRVRLVGEVEERDGVRERARHERHPVVGALPRALLLQEGAAGTVEGRGGDRVADAFAGAFVARRPREVLPVEAAPVRLDRRLVVGVHQLDAVPVREAVESGVEVPTLVELGLVRLVVDHHLQAVLVRQSKVEDAKLDRKRARFPVGGDRERPLVYAGRPVALHVDLDPERLPQARAHRQRIAAASAACVLGHELHRLPARRVARSGGRVGHPRPLRPAWRGDVHVVGGEELDRAVRRQARVGRLRRVGDRLAAAATPQLAQRGRERAHARDVGLDDHLERYDLVAGRSEADRRAVPHGVARLQRVRALVPLDLLAVGHCPDGGHARQPRRSRENHGRAGQDDTYHDEVDGGHGLQGWAHSGTGSLAEPPER